MNFQDLILVLQSYWAKQGCVILQPLDMEIGAGTFHPATFLKSLGPEPNHAAYVQPCRRPTDGRYGENPNRMQHYYQFQVVLKPSPPDLQKLYLGSLEAIGIDPKIHDIRFVEDNWESPTLGAWGLGWEVWLNGMEITQFTYFQQVGGLECAPVTGEITYGLERLAMYIQKVDSVFDLTYSDGPFGHVSYGDVFHRNEVEQSTYNFEHANTAVLLENFDSAEEESLKLIEAGLPLPAYEQVIQASHNFNLLDARNAISVTERQRYILRVRTLARAVAQSYYDSRQELGFPLLAAQAASADSEGAGSLNLASSPPPQPLPRRADDHQNLIIELGCEELPPKLLKKLAKGLADNLKGQLEAANLEFETVKWYATPRRLAVKVTQLAGCQQDSELEKRGPAVSAAFDADGQPTRAALGWAASSGITVDQAERLKTDKGEWLLCRLRVEGKSIDEILPGMIAESLGALPIPRPMRWGANRFSFIRPVHTFCVLYGDELIEAEILGQRSSRNILGHRFLTDGTPLVLERADDYSNLLYDQGRVIADYDQRRELIRRQITELATCEGATAAIDENLLDEVTSMVEWPVAMIGSFEEKFLSVPAEALISTMKDHQKYFPLRAAAGAAGAEAGAGTGTDAAPGRLLNRFCFVANIESSQPEVIATGNEKVIRPRLADAEFFFNQDRRHSLADLLPSLDRVTFQKQLGSLGDRASRLEKLTARIAELIGADPALAARAGLLAKADLNSAMVLEFPDMQGIAGKYYALHDGEPAALAAALEEQYLPRFAGDRVADTDIGAALAIADKVDILTGIFGIGQMPKADRDPFALRRAVIGLIRTIIERRYAALDVLELFAAAAEIYGDKLTVPRADLLDQLREFVEGRYRSFYADASAAAPAPAGIPGDVIQAVLARRPTRPLDFDLRIRAVNEFLADEGCAALAAANKRVANILARSEIPGAPDAPGDSAALPPLNPDLMSEAAEKQLYQLLESYRTDWSELILAGNYSEALTRLAQTRAAVDAFFDNVLVNVPEEDIRLNRLALLSRLREMFLDIADISLLQN